MNEYRVFVMGSDGYILQRIELHCADDKDAEHRAKAFVEGHAIELWQGARRIALFEPEH